MQAAISPWINEKIIVIFVKMERQKQFPQVPGLLCSSKQIQEIYAVELWKTNFEKLLFVLFKMQACATRREERLEFWILTSRNFYKKTLGIAATYLLCTILLSFANEDRIKRATFTIKPLTLVFNSAEFQKAISGNTGTGRKNMVFKPALAFFAHRMD